MSNSQSPQSLTSRYIACYISFAVIVAISVWLMLQLRVSMLQLGLVLGFSRYAMTVLDQFSLILLGLLWLIAFLAVEAYLRHGVRLNALWLRVGKVFAWEAALLVFAYAVQALPI